PPGLRYSTLASTVAAMPFVTELSRTSGVSPTRSSTVSAYFTRASLPAGSGILRGLGRVPDPGPVHLRERREGVRRRRGGAPDVEHLDAAPDERVADARAMAPPRHRLGAHDRDALDAREREQLLDAVGEPSRLHVVGVGAEARIAPRPVDRRRVDLAAAKSPELGQPLVPDAD